MSPRLPAAERIVAERRLAVCLPKPHANGDGRTVRDLAEIVQASASAVRIRLDRMTRDGRVSWERAHRLGGPKCFRLTVRGQQWLDEVRAQDDDENGSAE